MASAKVSDHKDRGENLLLCFIINNDNHNFSSPDKGESGSGSMGVGVSSLPS